VITRSWLPSSSVSGGSTCAVGEPAWAAHRLRRAGRRRLTRGSIMVACACAGAFLVSASCSSSTTPTKFQNFAGTWTAAAAYIVTNCFPTLGGGQTGIGAVICGSEFKPGLTKSLTAVITQTADTVTGVIYFGPSATSNAGSMTFTGMVDSTSAVHASAGGQYTAASVSQVFDVGSSVFTATVSGSSLTLTGWSLLFTVPGQGVTQNADVRMTVPVLFGGS
jgi:hypothetical protein